MSTVTIYGPAPSTYVRSARMFCVEKGVDYDLEEVDFSDESYKSLHPFQKIPAMRHGDFVLCETEAIGRYIDRVFDGPALQPTDAQDLANMDKWLSFIVDYIYQVAIRELVWPRLVVPSRGGEPDEELIAGAVPKLDYQLGLIEDAVGGGYLAGDAPSLADFVALPIMFYLKAAPEGQTLLASRPNINAWFDKIAQRESFAATMPPLPQAAE